MMRTTQSSAAPRVIGLGVLFFLCIGCSDSTDPGGTDPFVDQPSTAHVPCIADSECSDDETCRHNLCSLSAPTSPVEYGLLISPPNGAPVPAQRISPQSHSATDADFVVPTVEPIAGTAHDPDGEPAPDGTLVIDPVDAPALSTTQVPIRNGDFEFHLVPGEYRLTYIVDDSEWPRIPLQRRDFSDPPQTIDIQIPHLHQLRIVSGELTREALELLDLLSEPVTGAMIVARGSETGYRSTTAITDDEGRFQLRLPPGDDVFDILISPGPDNQLVPRLSLAEEITPQTTELSLSLGELELDLVTLSLQLDAEPIDDHRVRWRDYRVELHRSLETGQLRITPSIDEDGRAEIEVIAGIYDIEVIAPAGAPWSSTSQQLSLLDLSSAVEIELSARPTIDGFVSTEDGEAVAGALVDITPPESSQPSPPPVHTDPSGRFEFRLDPGDYRASIRPPIASGLPRVDTDFSVTSDTEELNLTPVVPRGFVATGTISTDTGQPLSYTSVNAYRIDEDGQLQLLGDALTTSDGTYGLVFDPQRVHP